MRCLFMPEDTEDGRGLDHLMEQNEAELSFLSAYGGVDSAKGEDGQAILEALMRFMRAGGLACELKENEVHFDFGTARAEPDGCTVKEPICPWFPVIFTALVFTTVNSVKNVTRSVCVSHLGLKNTVVS